MKPTISITRKLKRVRRGSVTIPDKLKNVPLRHMTFYEGRVIVVTLEALDYIELPPSPSSSNATRRPAKSRKHGTTNGAGQL